MADAHPLGRRQLAAGGDLDRALDALVEPGPRHRDPLVGERGTGELPPVPRLRDHALVRDEHLVEEDLVEQRLTGDLTQRPDLDAGRPHVDQEVGDPLVRWHVRVGAREADAPVGTLGHRGPHLLPREPPSPVDSLGAGPQRGEVRPGAGLGEELTPGQLAEQRRPHEAVPLRVAAVLQDRRYRPPGDHQVRPRDAGAGQLLVDHQLRHRVGPQAVRRGPVRCEVSGLHQGRSPLVLGRCGDALGDGPDVGPDRVVPPVEVDVDRAPYAGCRGNREPLGSLVGTAHQGPERERPPQVEVGVVLEGEPDPAEDLDAGLRRRDGAVEADRLRHVDGEGPLLVALIRGRRGVPCRRRHRLGRLEHLRAEVLHGLERSDRPPELLADLRVLHGGLQTPPRHAGGLGGRQRHRSAAHAGGCTSRCGVLGRPCMSGTEIDPDERLDLGGEPIAAGGHEVARGAAVPDGAVGSDLHAVAPGPTGHHRTDRGAQEAAGQQLVSARLERDRLVEQRPASAAGGLGHRDRSHAHLLDRGPDLVEAGGRIVLRRPDGDHAALTRRPFAQALGELDLLVGDADRHAAPRSGN